ncbi:MAG: uroporphyrinogen-III C-methyltransferase [Vulcanisaeta sp.]|jgi:uroporphyrin-III C-methyltransferase
MPIYVVGAGPWDPELITLKAIKILRNADIVYYGSLVNEEIIKMYAPRAQKIYMGHVRGEDHNKFVKQALELAREGLNVVFLKNGDPAIFGRGIEICKEAISNGIPCEVVPGVSSFTAAVAKYLIDLRGIVVLMAYPNIDYNISADTKVIFMGTKIINELITKLRNDEEAVIVSRLTYPDEEVVTLSKDHDPNIDVKPPALVIIRRRGGYEGGE